MTMLHRLHPALAAFTILSACAASDPAVSGPPATTTATATATTTATVAAEPAQDVSPESNPSQEPPRIDGDVRLVDASELQYRCGPVRHGTAPIDLGTFDPAGADVLAAIDRVATRGGGDVVDGVPEWVTFEMEPSVSTEDDLVAIGRDDASEAYSFVSLQRTAAGGVRFTGWDQCRATASLDGYSSVEIESVDVADGVMTVTGTEASCAGGRSIDGVPVAASISTDASDTVALAFFVEAPPGSTQSCPGNPTATFSVPLPVGSDGAVTVLDGSVTPPVPLGDRFQRQEDGHTTMILAADPALLDVSPIIYQQAKSGVPGVAGGGIVFDGPGGSPALLVHHLPGERALAEAAAATLLTRAGLTDVAVVYEERNWSVAGQSVMFTTLETLLPAVLDRADYRLGDTIFGIEIGPADEGMAVGGGFDADTSAIVEQVVTEARTKTGFTGPVVLLDRSTTREL